MASQGLSAGELEFVYSRTYVDDSVRIIRTQVGGERQRTKSEYRRREMDRDENKSLARFKWCGASVGTYTFAQNLYICPLLNTLNINNEYSYSWVLYPHVLGCDDGDSGDRAELEGECWWVGGFVCGATKAHKRPDKEGRGGGEQQSRKVDVGVKPVWFPKWITALDYPGLTAGAGWAVLGIIYSSSTRWHRSTRFASRYGCGINAVLSYIHRRTHTNICASIHSCVVDFHIAWLCRDDDTF